MDKLIIEGGTPLEGAIEVNGSKNAAIYAAQILGATMPEYQEKIVAFKQAMAEAVMAKDANLQEEVAKL